MTVREGSLEAPTRHPIDWRNPDYYDRASLDAELERVFDICHGCRRCVSLCNAFPTLFDLVDASKDVNAPPLAELARDGCAILTPVPSCTLMFKHEMPLLFPEDPDVRAVSDAMFDPFEYLVLRDRDGLLKKDFQTPLGKVSYHIPCHSRAQLVGQKTREVIEWVPGTTVDTVERCAGHDGTWGVKREFYATSMKIGRPVFRQIALSEPDYISSDCPIAGRAIEQGVVQTQGKTGARKAHPLTLLRIAYGLPE